MGTLKVGFIGCGLIASVHATTLRGLRQAGLAEVEIGAVTDTDGERATRFAEYFGASEVSGMDEVAAASDAVYVCTSTRSHLDGVGAAARAGRPIFCEKPLGRTLDESLSLAALAREAGVPVQVGLVLRTAPVFRRLGDIVGSGRFGRAMAVIVRDDQFFPTRGHYASSWRSEVAVAGSGALLEHSIHDLDIVQVCFGPIESVVASLGNFEGHEGIEDSASALLRTASGLSVSLVSVWHEVLSRPSTRRLEVLFEQAFVSLDNDFTGPLTVQTSETTELWECPPPDWVRAVPLPPGEQGLGIRAYVEENRSFVQAVTDGHPPSPGLEEALGAHRVVDACYRSAAAGGTPVSLG